MIFTTLSPVWQIDEVELKYCKSVMKKYFRIVVVLGNHYREPASKLIISNVEEI